VVRLRDVNLPPDVFAVAMATGIIAVAGRDHRYWRIADVLGVAATAAFVVLGVGLLARFAVGPGDILAQARDPDVALRMFTFVAACGVLGVRWVQHPTALWLAGALGLVGWLVLAPLGISDVRSRRRDELRDHAHGAWLLPSVATAGLATTAADLARAHSSTVLVAVGAAFWLIGIGTYLAVTWLIAWRALAAPYVPGEVTPDSWILMGALAITTLAGCHIDTATRAVGGAPWIADWARPLTFATWIVATAWVPVLLYAEIWSVDQQSGSLHYKGVWWSAVFPLGMYSAASSACAHTFHLRALTTVSLVFFWVAATVWTMVALGLVHAGLRTVRRRRSLA